MNVSDHVQMLKSKETPYESLFEKRDWLYVNDTNQSYESATSIIETASLANSSKYCDYNKSYLSIPFVATFTQKNNSGVLEAVPATSKILGVKQSFLSLINSITVDLNGTNVVQQSNLIDLVNNFQLLTQESDTTKPRWATIGFSNKKENDSGATGREDLEIAEQNMIYQTGDVINESVSSMHKSNIVEPGTGKVLFNCLANIYLKDLHPLFKSIPISKALNFKIQIFWNHASSTTINGASTNVRQYNGTNPLRFTQLTSDPGTQVASINIGNKVLGPNSSNGMGTGNVGEQVILHVPAVQMKPSIESDYISSVSTKEIKYIDYYQYRIENVSSGSTFNKLVSNGVSKLKGVLIFPQSVLDTHNNNINYFGSGLPLKNGIINNLQILVGGSNVLNNDLRYNYQTFNNEILNSFGINGNESQGLGSGLIDFNEWYNNPYYFIDCSRTPDELSNAYRSLQITGRNVSTRDVNYIVFAFYERGFKLNTLSGEIEPII